MILAVAEQSLDRATWAFVIVGAVMALAWVVEWWGRGGDPLGAAPERLSHLRPECIPACLLTYLVAAAMAQGATEQFVKPGMSADAAGLLDRVVPPVIGSLFGAVGCVWYGRQGFTDGLRGYGLTRRDAGGEALAGVVGWFIATAVCAGLLVLCEFLIERLNPAWKAPGHPALDAIQMRSMPGWVRAFAAVGPVAVAPIAEELFFRGIVQSFLKQYMGGRWRPILIGAVIFGGAHYIQPQVVLPLTALGLILGYAYERRGSLVAPIVVHVLFNLRTIVWQTLLTAGGSN